jgi:hypothetical protein
MRGEQVGGYLLGRVMILAAPSIAAVRPTALRPTMVRAFVRRQRKVMLAHDLRFKIRTSMQFSDVSTLRRLLNSMQLWRDRHLIPFALRSRRCRATICFGTHTKSSRTLHKVVVREYVHDWIHRKKWRSTGGCVVAEIIASDSTTTSLVSARPRYMGRSGECRGNRRRGLSSEADFAGRDHSSCYGGL